MKTIKVKSLRDIECPNGTKLIPNGGTNYISFAFKKGQIIYYKTIYIDDLESKYDEDDFIPISKLELKTLLEWAMKGNEGQ